jgi:integrase
VTGKRVRKTVYGDTQRECREKLEALQEKFSEGAVPDSEMPLRNFLDLWLSGLRGSLAWQTFRRYRLVVADLKEYLGDRPLSQLSATHVIRMYEAMREDEEVGPTAPHMAGKRLRQALAAAVRMGYVKKNVAKDVPIPRLAPPDIHPLTPEQVTTLLRASGGTIYRPFWVLALDSGAR